MRPATLICFTRECQNPTQADVQYHLNHELQDRNIIYRNLGGSRDALIYQPEIKDMFNIFFDQLLKDVESMRQQWLRNQEQNQNNIIMNDVKNILLSDFSSEIIFNSRNGLPHLKSKSDLDRFTEQYRSYYQQHQESLQRLHDNIKQLLDVFSQEQISEFEINLQRINTGQVQNSRQNNIVQTQLIDQLSTEVYQHYFTHRIDGRLNQSFCLKALEDIRQISSQIDYDDFRFDFTVVELGWISLYLESQYNQRSDNTIEPYLRTIIQSRGTQEQLENSYKNMLILSTLQLTQMIFFDKKQYADYIFNNFLHIKQKHRKVPLKIQEKMLHSAISGYLSSQDFDNQRKAESELKQVQEQIDQIKSQIKSNQRMTLQLMEQLFDYFKNKQNHKNGG